MSEFDSIVMGAGIVGSACAFALAKNGMRVALIEPCEPGQGATAAGMGHVVIMDDSPAELALTHYSQSLWQELAKKLPHGCEYHQIGTLWIATDEEEMEAVMHKQPLYRRHGIPAEVFSSRQVAAVEPNLRCGLAGGLLAPSDGVVFAPVVARLLVDECRAIGGTFIQDRAVSMGHGAVTLSRGETLKAKHLINATGVDAGKLTSGLPIRPRKGHVAITEPYAGLAKHDLMELGYLKSAHSASADSVAFNLQPRASGQLLIGSSRQFDANDLEIDDGILSRMFERAEWFVPGLKQIPVERVWTGFRAATPDNLPLIGPWPKDETVYLATGHEGLGITTALGTAELIAAQLSGREPAIPIEPYLPARLCSRTA